MKIKYTQCARDARDDTDFALAMALEEGGAGVCDSDDDDDFQVQGLGSSPVFFKQTLALRSCAVKKQVKKRVLPKSLRLGKKQRVGGDVGDGVRVADRAGSGKELEIRRGVVSEIVRENTAASTGSGVLGWNDGECRRREPTETEKRVLRDHNSSSAGRVETNRAFWDTMMLDKGDENEKHVSSGKLQMFLIPSTPIMELKKRQDRTDWRVRSSFACDNANQQWQSGSILEIGSTRKTEPSIHETGCSLQSSDSMEARKIRDCAENADVRIFAQVERSAGPDPFGLNGKEIVEIDSGDEDTVICTQAEARIEKECDQSVGELGRVAIDTGKKSDEDRPKRKHNIYDILLGNNRTDRVLTTVSNPTIDTEIECDASAEEMDNPGTAMRALIDEAELDYEGLEFNDEDNESMDSFECHVSGTDAVDLCASDREQHVGDCLEIGNVTCERIDPMDCRGREVLSTGATEVAQVSCQRTVTIETFECPVCGICMEELSTAQREEHTNACLEKDDSPCGKANPGYFPSREAGISDTGGISHMLTSQRNVIIEGLACPVCGVCIEELSTSQREEHTNSCLDETKGEGPVEVAELAGTRDLGKPDTGPVVTWLTDLNLGKYVDIFIKEEIDWDTLKWLTEEDLSSLGITALGPRRKIVCAIQELRKPASTTQQITAMQEGQKTTDSAVPSSPVDTLKGSQKSIMDFFILPANARLRTPTPDRNITSSSKSPAAISTPVVSTKKRVPGRPISTGENTRNVRSSDIPTWMCIPGTSFRVDAFKYTTGNCSNWFLTHFHTDHYQGLTRGFRHGKIFCSTITARLVNLRIGIPSDRIQALPLNETVLIDGTRVTFIDANHCPGSVMILFEPPNGKAVLHTGDFRFCSDMTCNEVLRACRISTLILDTTYCDPQYDFPKQDAVVQFVIDAIQAEAFNSKTLFLIGTYTIGKERIFLEVGKALQQYVYVGAAKQRLLDCMDLAEEDRRWLTRNDQDSHIHVVPLWSVASFKRMGSISRHYHTRYNSIVAFSPTGWTFGKGKKRIQGRPGRRFQQGSIIRYEVPYSEHSSFTELKEFVRTIGSENIVPSVISSTGLTADAMVASLLSEDS